MKNSKPKATCTEYALGLLSGRAYASGEMAEKLHKKGYAKEDIEHTFNRLYEMEYLDDNKYAIHRVKYRADVSGWGKLKISQELRQKGIKEEIINNAMQTWEEGDETNQGLFAEEHAPHSWQENANELLERKFGAWPKHLKMDSSFDEFEQKKEHLKAIEKEKSKRLSFLIRKGFTMQQALTALKQC